MFIEICIATISITLLSLVGVFFFGKKGHVTGSHRFILPTAVGVFLGVIFFELIPETLEASHTGGSIAILAGFFGFYFLSHIFETFHHHHHIHVEDTCAHGGAKRLLIGDAVHNFVDGIIIASAFMIDTQAGIILTLGIALHEIPQEIAEFGVLIHTGCTRTRAVLYNSISASMVILGAFVTVPFAHFFISNIYILTGIAAGNLLYIATADLLPELRNTHKKHFLQTFFATLIGTVSIACLIVYTHRYTERTLSTEHTTNVVHTETH
jgi:zinc and cadmium transporter